MTDRCRKTVRGVVGEAWSDAEIDDVLTRLQAAKQRAKAKDPLAHDDVAWDEAAAEITREEVTAALMQRRLEFFSKRADKARSERLAQLEAGGLDEAEQIRAHDVGTDKQAGFGGASVDAEGAARVAGLVAPVTRALEADPVLMSRLSSPILSRTDPEFERLVVREMARLNGADVAATGDAGAVKAARLFVDALDAGRIAQNREGAWIGKIDGFVGRQNHDRLLVAGGFWREVAAAGLRTPWNVLNWKGVRLAAARKAFRDWRDFTRPLLDERTFDGLTLREASEGVDEQAQAMMAGGAIDDATDPREVFLYAAWWNIVQGKDARLAGMSDLGEFRAPPGKARSVSKARVLHYAGPDAWSAYAERFSRGGLYASVMTDLERAGRNSALMARWSPNPEAAREAEIMRLTQKARARGDEAAARKLKNGMRQAEFDEITGAGNSPDSLRLAIVGRSIRMAETLSKLGGIVVAAIGDGSFAAQRMKRAGGTYLDGYNGIIRGVTRLQGETGMMVADAMDVGARGVATSLQTRFSAADGPLGWSSWLQRKFFQANLMEFWTNGHRAGQAQMLASIWGRQAERPWSALDAASRDDFQRFGIGEAEWELVRPAAEVMDDGRPYLTLDAIRAVSDENLLAWSGWDATRGPREAAIAEARSELTLRFQTMIMSVLDDTQTQARARERVGLTRGLKPGTPAGEAIRLMTQFLSFSQTVIGRHLVPAMRGYGGMKPVSLTAHLIVSSMALGYLSLQMGQVLKGRTPRPLEDDEGESQVGSVVIASLLKGGGLGFYGDFLFGEANRAGLPFRGWSSLMGPAVSDSEKLFAIVSQAVWGDDDERADAGGDAVKFAITSAPGANLFYTRALLDYLVLWRLQEQMSPGYLARYEQRVRDREGSDFLVDPSEAVTGS